MSHSDETAGFTGEINKEQRGRTRAHPSAVLIPCTRCGHPRASSWAEVHRVTQPPPPSIAGAEDPTDAEGHVGTHPGSPVEESPQLTGWDKAGSGLTHVGYSTSLSLPGDGHEVPA